MKILMTGATGFLGKRLLELLLDDERIARIDVISRSKTFHPHAKVRMVAADLSHPAFANSLTGDYDSVVHLAASYDFRESFTANYRQNVLPALHLASAVRGWSSAGRRIPIFHASTYAVGARSSARLEEIPLKSLPPRSIPYAYTKALAERAITDSGLPCAVFRLGILVGTSTDGSIEKIDGPYYLLDFLRRLSRLPGASRLRALPLPAREDALLPLVPVDSAARVIHAALVMPDATWDDGARIYGVYRTDSIPAGKLLETILPSYLPKARAVYLDRIPAGWGRLAERLTGIPENAFHFSSDAPELGNKEFQRQFGADAIPSFMAYRPAFVSGFQQFAEGAPRPQARTQELA